MIIYMNRVFSHQGMWFDCLIFAIPFFPWEVDFRFGGLHVPTRSWNFLQLPSCLKLKICQGLSVRLKSFALSEVTDMASLV